MRRRIVIITLLLIGGAVVNVAVAWGLAAYAPVFATGDDWLQLSFDEWSESNIDWWRANYPFDEPAVPVYSPPPTYSTSNVGPNDHVVGPNDRVLPAYVARDRMVAIRVAGLDFLQASGTSVNRGLPEVASVTRLRAGAPLKSMEAAKWRLNMPRPEPRREHIFVGAVPVNVARESDEWLQLTFATGQRFIPLRPIWPGFIINTLVYALVLWLLYIAPVTVRRALRRMIRRRREQCEKCGYPIGVSPICTECGAAIARHQPRP